MEARIAPALSASGAGSMVIKSNPLSRGRNSDLFGIVVRLITG